MPLLIAIAVGVSFVLWATGRPIIPQFGKVELPPNPLGQFRLGDRVIIIGLPLSGKTYLAGKLTKDVPRILFFDPYHDYKEAAKATEVKADDLIKNPKMLHTSRFRLSIIPNEDFLADQLEDCVSIARAAGNLVFVMDEVGDYKKEATNTLEKLARNGRHDGLVPIYVSQVAMDIPRTVRRLASQVYSFRQNDIDDLDALRERYGDAFAEKVSRLPPHEFAKWTPQVFARSNQSPEIRRASSDVNPPK